MHRLTLGFSPCPNDTFIFDAMIHHKIDTEGLEFECVIQDVEQLNQKASRAELDITKLSYHAFAYFINNYVLLDAGSALGFGVGPLLITHKEIYESLNLKKDSSDLATKLTGLKTGIPGKLTTANFLLDLAFPLIQNKVEMLFSDIENALIERKIDLGLIIHENRFTYQSKGLYKIIDLGNFWEQETHSAIPLGGIVANRKLGREIQLKVNRIIRRSIEFAFANPKSSYDFVRKHSQEMSEEVMYKHIELYVNKYSLNLGEEGRKAVQTLFDKAYRLQLIPNASENIFITQES